MSQHAACLDFIEILGSGRQGGGNQQNQRGKREKTGEEKGFHWSPNRKTLKPMPSTDPVIVYPGKNLNLARATRFGYSPRK
jgi:hypothetical protein